MGSPRLHRRVLALNRLLAHQHEGPYNTDDPVLYLIMGSAASAERAALQHRTWCRTARCAFVTDDHQAPYDADMRLVHLGQASHPDVIAELCCANATTTAERTFFCSSHRHRTLPAQYRFLPALSWAKRQVELGERTGGSFIQWVAIVDDDSFVFPRSLRQVVSRHDASTPLHLGDFWPAEDGTPLYACGGGGAVFSRGALARLDLHACIRTMHRQCSQSDWMMGKCAREAGVRLAPEHGCTCVPWADTTEGHVRTALQRGECSFLQFPNSPGSRGGPFKDLVSLLWNMTRSIGPPAIVHQLDRLV